MVLSDCCFPLSFVTVNSVRKIFGLYPSLAEHLSNARVVLNMLFCDWAFAVLCYQKASETGKHEIVNFPLCTPSKRDHFRNATKMILHAYSRGFARLDGTLDCGEEIPPGVRTPRDPGALGQTRIRRFPRPELAEPERRTDLYICCINSVFIFLRSLLLVSSTASLAIVRCSLSTKRSFPMFLIIFFGVQFYFALAVPVFRVASTDLSEQNTRGCLGGSARKPRFLSHWGQRRVASKRVASKPNRTVVSRLRDPVVSV